MTCASCFRLQPTKPRYSVLSVFKTADRPSRVCFVHHEGHNQHSQLPIRVSCEKRLDLLRCATKNAGFDRASMVEMEECLGIAIPAKLYPFPRRGHTLIEIHHSSYPSQQHCTVPQSS